MKAILRLSVSIAAVGALAGCFQNAGIQKKTSLGLAESEAEMNPDSPGPGAPTVPTAPTPPAALPVDSQTLSVAARADVKSAVVRLPMTVVGFPPPTVTSVHRDFKRIGGSLVIASPVGLGVSNDNGVTWVTRNGRNGLDGAIYSSVQLGSALFVGGAAGLFVSRDGGLDFERVALPATTPTAASPTIVSVRATKGVILAANLADGGDGLFASTDNGATFRFRALAAMPGICGRIAKLAVLGDRFLAVCAAATGYPGGIAYSDDGGANWTRATLPATFDANTFRQLEHAIVASGTQVFYGGYTQFFVSNDRGASFAARPLDANTVLVRGVAVAGGKILAATTSGIALSENGGATFQRIVVPAGATTNAALDLAANGNEVLLANGVSLRATADGGRTAVVRATADASFNSPVAQLLVSGASVYAATSAGVFYSGDNGGTAKKIDVDPAAPGGNYVNTIAFGGLFGNRFEVATNDGIYTTFNLNPAGATRTWNRKGPENGLGILDGFVNCSGSGGGIAIGCVRGGYIFSEDDGATYTFHSIPGGGETYRFLVGGLVQMYATEGGIYRSGDGGVSFRLLNATSGVGLIANKANEIKAVGGKTYALLGAGFVTSTNDGASWTTPILRRNGAVVNMTAAGDCHGVAAFGNRVYVGTQYGLAVSTDNGASFTLVSTGIGEGPHDLAIKDVGSSAASGTLYYGTSRGIFRVLREPAIQ